ncbi:MAG: hypothetical protein AAGH87_00955 [Pseudomonadota bacterium]
MLRPAGLIVSVVLVCGAVIYGVTRSQGLDLLDPRYRLIGALALATTLYAGLRIGLFLNQVLASRAAAEEGDGAQKRSAFQRWGRSSALDARMDARRARLAAAKAKKPPEDAAD